MVVSKKVSIKSKTNSPPATLEDKRKKYMNVSLCVALGILALLSAWVFSARSGNLGYLSSSDLLPWVVEPAVVSILVMIFSLTFIYKSFRHETISLIARAVAWILITLVALALISVTILSGQCSSVTNDCSMEFLFILAALYYTYFFIPVLMAALAVIGTLTLLINKVSNITAR